VKISTIAGKELTSSLADRWAAWHQADAALSSPYFHPEFTRCVARLKPNVEIAVLEEENRVVGFFPYERVSSSLGRPVGGVLSDFHGLVCDAGVKIDPLDLLRACKLAAWDFSHLPISQPFFSKQRRSLVPSPQIDLARGYALFLGKKRPRAQVSSIARPILSVGWIATSGRFDTSRSNETPGFLTKRSLGNPRNISNPDCPTCFGLRGRARCCKASVTRRRRDSPAYYLHCMPGIDSSHAISECGRKASGITGFPPTIRLSLNIRLDYC
jgi:hypothetical protein